MTGIRSGRNLVSAFVLGAVVVACSPSASSSPSATTSPSAAPSQAASAGSIVLDRTEPIGCDAIGVDYKSATIKIDAASDSDVWAQTDTGKQLVVKWTSGFTATDAVPPVINGPKGEEVARDGTKIDVPAAATPRLAGYFVCLGEDAISVLEADPQ